MDNPPDPTNADAILGERDDPGNWLLCDPVRSPDVYARVSELHRRLRVYYMPERTNANPDLYPEDQVQTWRSRSWTCDINLVDRCDGDLEDFPVDFGGMAMVPKICRACKAKAQEDAQIGMAISIMEANEQARESNVDNPPGDPNDDA
jgi:hypothetical protein